MSKLLPSDLPLLAFTAKAREPRRLAYHEAGHVVAARAFGRHVAYISINPAAGAGEVVFSSPATMDDPVRKARETAIILLAGPVAQQLALGDASWWRCASDLNQTLRLIGWTAGHGDPWPRLLQLASEARQVLTTGTRWREVEAQGNLISTLSRRAQP